MDRAQQIFLDSFAPIVGNGTYTIAMLVTNDVNEGSIGLQYPGTATLTGPGAGTNPPPVPEPTSMILLGSGIVGVIAKRRARSE